MHIKTVYGWVPLHTHCVNSNQDLGAFKEISIEEARSITGLRAQIYEDTVNKYLDNKATFQDVLSSLGKPLKGAFGENL